MLKLVSLDLDGTLIHPAIFNAVADKLGFGDALDKSYQAYLDGTMSLEEAFHHDYAHFVGRPVSDMHAALQNNPAWTDGIAEAVQRLRDAGIDVIITTDQPRFLVESAKQFGLTTYVCSEADLRHGRVTDQVRPEFEKWPNLQRHLNARKIDPRHIAHIGNGTNDIPVFQKTGTSIAVNALHPSVNHAATHQIPQMKNLNEAADLLLKGN